LELLIGCGSSRDRRIPVGGRTEWSGLVTLDLEARHRPDVVFDLDHLPLPFEDDAFDEIHGYEVLEHCGRQGDWRFFLAQFAEFWRILKPGGVVVGTVPAPHSPWAWGDPGHTRVIPPESFTFLSQLAYAQVGRTSMSDYRSHYRADFDVAVEIAQDTTVFLLRAIKPSRWVP
jgi:SAM-dependent methyltransferase